MYMGRLNVKEDMLNLLIPIYHQKSKFNYIILNIKNLKPFSLTKNNNNTEVFIHDNKIKQDNNKNQNN